MARPRTPTLKAATTGATLKNPGRFKDRRGPTRTRPLGDPYAAMSEPECAYWREISGSCPWLHSAHRVLLRATCRLAALLDSQDVPAVPATMALASLLGRLGASPSDETKVRHRIDDVDDDDFASRYLT